MIAQNTFQSDSKTLLPFLRWIGGKQWMVRILCSMLPHDIYQSYYWEPFVGAASLFFSVRPHRGCLADANSALIECYRRIAENPERIASYLESHRRQSSQAYYYAVRCQYNASRNPISMAQAARFIYLNRACFNGVFRVNNGGEFNVPYGFKERLIVPDAKSLRSAQIALKSVDLRQTDFRSLLTSAETGDFVFLDPPYPPLDGTAYFTHYTSERFTRQDHLELAEIVRSLDAKRVRVLMTNADLPWLRSLYQGFRFRSLPTHRYVSCKQKKRRVNELVILNY